MPLNISITFWEKKLEKKLLVYKVAIANDI